MFVLDFVRYSMLNIKAYLNRVGPFDRKLLIKYLANDYFA
jgi:hypothetical protein